MSEFERWETRFSGVDYVFGEAPSAFLVAHRDLLPRAGRALAVADGEGRNGVFLAERGLDVVSTDFSPSAQAKARALAARRGVGLDLVRADAHDWDYPPAAFDVVIDIFTQFSTPDLRARKWAGVRRALKPGGLLLLEGYTPDQIAHGTGGPRDPAQLYTRELLEREFAWLASREIRAYETVLSEGAGHSGPSAVIDLIGRA
ncbi:MAG: class I SAM-dependent methyltransferase [Rhizobiales bacterium]|nr:class I SAM-dependent methyltransferase [Hyphomicrobiales bacterium]